MRSDFLPFSRPCIKDEDINAVAEVLRSGWITTGPKAADFEKRFSDYLGGQSAVAVSSATGGMHVSLNALGIGPGDEVITPSLTWVSTANLIVLSGAKPVFVDVDRETLMVNAATVESAITPRTRAIIPVHYAGAPVDIDAIREVAARHGIRVIEDAAHATGTYYKGRRIGSGGTAIFSFHAIKNLTTAEGGMVVSDDPEFIDRIRRLKFHGLGVDAFDRHTQGRSPQAEVLEPGYKYNMPDIAAVLGIRQLERIEEINRMRHSLAQYYREKLIDVDGVIPLGNVPYQHAHAWHLFIVRVIPEKAGCSRDEFMQALKERNIGTGLHFRAIHLQKYYAETFGIKRGSLPNTEWNSDRICSLPLFPDMKAEDVNDVVNAVRDVVRR